MEKEEAVWGRKVRNAYRGGGRMAGGSLTPSPHYHFLHYAESDPLGHRGQGWGGGGVKQVAQHITPEEAPEESER